jgi:LmbE family N-acetylglucosaminyl deacetylase
MFSTRRSTRRHVDTATDRQGDMSTTRLRAMPIKPMPSDWQRALVIAAHPDDIEYGLAAAVAAWTGEGKEVHYLLATRGEAGMAGVPPEEAGPLREDEERRSAAVVGVTEVEFLDFQDGVLVAGPELRKAIAGAIRRHRPNMVVTGYHGATWSPPGLTPGFLNSADHLALGQSVLHAVADASNEWIFRDLTDPPWKVQYVAVSELLDPPHEVDVADQVEKAVESLSEHRRYLELLSDTPVEEQARQIVDMATLADDGRRRVSFKLYWG